MHERKLFPTNCAVAAGVQAMMLLTVHLQLESYSQLPQLLQH